MTLTEAINDIARQYKIYKDNKSHVVRLLCDAEYLALNVSGTAEEEIRAENARSFLMDAVNKMK
jgi:hypothetical protein